MAVVLETTLGDITVDLYLKERPNTCLNFLKLCKLKYYNFCIFHRIERNFVAQTGDPTSTGRGGESVFCHLYGEQAKFFDMETKPRLKHEKMGTLSMINNGNNMNGSQFFFTLGENLTYLDESHTVFGEIVEGFEVLQKINESICDPNKRPYQDIRITHTVILHDPYEDPSGLEIPDCSPKPTKETLESNYIGADEEIDDTKGKTMEEVEEKIKESEAKARATILEMVGDLPDADVKPAENVLFVCKLNPVTTSEDLEVIFSRFGSILSCEVIKDQKTGDSLQYAFIEFEKEEDCENAYFKMDNVLIDDRRIHVDFSQSVSKLNRKGENSFMGSNRRQRDNFEMKSVKPSDGYEMIFDMDENEPHKNRSHKDRTSKKYERNSHSRENKKDEYDYRADKGKHSSFTKKHSKDFNASHRYQSSRENEERHSKIAHDRLRPSWSDKSELDKPYRTSRDHSSSRSRSPSYRRNGRDKSTREHDARKIEMPEKQKHYKPSKRNRSSSNESSREYKRSKVLPDYKPSKKRNSSTSSESENKFNQSQGKSKLLKPHKSIRKHRSRSSSEDQVLNSKHKKSASKHEKHSRLSPGLPSRESALDYKNSGKKFKSSSSKKHDNYSKRSDLESSDDNSYSKIKNKKPRQHSKRDKSSPSEKHVKNHKSKHSSKSAKSSHKKHKRNKSSSS